MQPIRAPSPHLLTHVGLSCRGRVTKGPLGRMKPGYGGKRPRKPLVAALNLTPLIDVMMVMVCFLLLNFKAEGQSCGCGPRGIKRPLACMAGKLTRAPIVSIAPPSADDPDGVVTLDGSEVSSLSELLNDESPDWKIARLTEQLEVKKHNWKMTNPDKTFPGQVIVDADREVAFKALKKVVYSVGLAGYHELHFVVERPDPERTGWP
jgi:biopolymer transport protein ExbD